MSEEKTDLEKKLNEEREKHRLNQIRTLKFLGYKGDTSKMTEEQLEARVELLMEKKQNETGDPESPTPVLFQGIDEERENADAVENAAGSKTPLTFEELISDYDALTAQIPFLRSNAEVGHMEAFNEKQNIRILRLPAAIKLDNNHSLIRRVIL